MPLSLDSILPWGRSFDEYRRMFALGEADLRRRILGCGDGPAAFNAELTARGGDVVSIDPLYRFSAKKIAARIEQVFDGMIEKAREKQSVFLWEEIRSPEHLGEIRRAAMDRFLEDFRAGKKAGRYVNASLPKLPFDDNAFDLALCGHYLFTYSDLLSEENHLAAILEMARVADEVRIFPLVDMFDGGESPHLPPVVRQLKDKGFSARIRPVPYEFQRGGNRMLVVGRVAGRSTANHPAN